MSKYTIPHIRLGSTSFLVRAGYVAGVRFAAERCEDVALLLMETGKNGEFLASPEEIREIGTICRGEGASLHVHLPTDGNFGTEASTRELVAGVRAAIERADPLAAHSFVLHIDFPPLRGVSLASDPADAGLSAEQRQWTAEALAEIAACLPDPGQLAIENLETFPADFWDGWIEGSPHSRCLDIGHVWKNGADPTLLLERWLPRVRVIHLHGLKRRKPGQKTILADEFSSPDRARDLRYVSPASERLSQIFGTWPQDHTSLVRMPPDCIDAVMHPLWRAGFAGVLNLEVFGFEDFIASHAVLLHSWERYSREEEALPGVKAVPEKSR